MAASISTLLAIPTAVCHTDSSSFVTAMEHPEKVAGLILLYPGFVLIEDLHRSFDTLEMVPNRFVFNKWFPVGRCFASDVWNFDPYTQIGNYKKPVLILHGDSDPLLPASWSLMAASAYTYPNYHIIKDGKHGFREPALNEALVYIRSYLEKHIIRSFLVFYNSTPLQTNGYQIFPITVRHHGNRTGSSL